ncbi:hybrid sensor histidine kinase/response regulator [Ramlibacter sp.]|uniref:hybrid sensor histidine kinase/response regulator n=1 Tax=Ramlibacter sp. TaxID=1917967 RepID=UPI002B58F107|nr:response regulator [Ramlibacter sp.]HWI84174.1 response regulator [Ramlibacter sp.]
MKLDELIAALAGEVEAAQPRLARSLDQLAALEGEDPAFMDALEQYSGQAQRMGEASELAGFPGLQAVCNHVLENMLVIPMLPPDERGPLVEFLRGWPPLIVQYLRNVGDPSAAAGLVDHLVRAPYPLEEDQSLKVMHMLGAMPQQAQPEPQPARPVLATAQDVALVMPEDVDQKLLEGFLHEAPQQARYLVDLARNMVSGQGDSSDLVAARRVAHTLKGSGAIIGLRGLASLGHHFEDILDHFERAGGQVAKPAADALLDAAYCLEQMVGHVAGADDYPDQAQAVLQRVLDLANRIDRGESLEVVLERVAPAEDAEPAAGAVAAPVSRPGARVASPTASPTAALRVTVERVDELFRLAGEVSVHSAAMEAHIKLLQDRSRELLGQNLRVQKRLFELETLVDAPRRARARHGARVPGHVVFDPLEMDQFSELHGTAHALMEEAADARALAQRLEEGIAGLGGVQLRQQRLAKDLQHLVIGTRMTAVGGIESRLQRNVRSTCQATGKQAQLVLEGGDTQVDSDLLNRLTDPLLHLLRNAVDHGLEFPDERAALGKDPAGRITLAFARQGQQVVLRCGDDGRGLDLPAIRQRAVDRGLVAADQVLSDEEVSRLILLPGFSTSQAVSEVSGRGIGLDVVREWAAGIGGTVRIESAPGRGCTVELRFAASLSTIQSLVVEASGQRFALASQHIEQAVPRGAGRFEPVGEGLAYRHGQRVLRAVRLAQACGLPLDADKPWAHYDAVIVRVDAETMALAVDRLVDSRELLVKSPGRYARHIRGVVGLSVLGDGGVAVNLDLAQLLAGGAAQRAAPAPAGIAAPQKALPGVLIVDDALSVRNTLVQLVQDAGFRAEAARDGVDAIDAMRLFRPDVVLTDLEMPNMNGIELTTHIRSRDDLKGLPVIMITSRSQEKHRRLATEAGVDSYITKPYNDGELLHTIRQALAA